MPLDSSQMITAYCVNSIVVDEPDFLFLSFCVFLGFAHVFDLCLVLD